MKKHRDWAQVGYLAVLLAWALLGTILQLSGEWRNEATGDDEGGGPIAVIGIMGVIGFFVIFGIQRIVRVLVARPPREARGFPVEPRPTNDARGEVE